MPIPNDDSAVKEKEAELPPPPASLLEVIIRPLTEGPMVRVATKHNVDEETFDSSTDVGAPWKELRFELKEFESLEIRPKLVGAIEFDYDQSANIKRSAPKEEARKATLKDNKVKAEKAEKADQERLAKERADREKAAKDEQDKDPIRDRASAQPAPTGAKSPPFSSKDVKEQQGSPSTTTPKAK